MVGDLLGAGAAQEQAVVGETPNLAARLQGLAQPGCAVIDAETRRRIGGLFDCDELGAVQLKGLPGLIRAWQVLGEARVQSRFEVMHPATLAPLVGREDELDLLLRRWQQARAGEGQVVLVSGEAGIGKSRLIAALENELTADELVRLKYFCSPHHRNSALQPIIARWENEAGFVRGEAAEARLGKLEALLLPLRAPPEKVALIAEMLGVPGGERYPPLDLSPPRKKEQTFRALGRVLEQRVRQSPVLMLFEDANWADPSSLELLDRVLARLASLPVLLVISYRPEFQAPWIGQPGVSVIALSRLGPRHAATLASQVVVDQALPAGMLESIVIQSDGVPLFIEELTKAVLESAGRASASALPVPSTLQASLMARLDRLPAANQVAQIGAVIGREFSHELLAAVAGLSEAALSRGLGDLVGAGLAFRRGTPPDAVYSFKHALVQDAAYVSLLRGTRQELHARIAKALETRIPERVVAEPEVLAHHFTQAGLTAQAVDYWLGAGEHAAGRSANAEAVAHLRRGLDLVAALPPGSDRARRELALRLAIGGPLIATQGFSATETTEAHARARELCEEYGDNGQLLLAVYGEWAGRYMRSEVQDMRALAARFRALADRDARPGVRLVATRMLAIDRLISGELVEARTLFESILTRYDPAEQQGLAASFGLDARAACLTYMTWVLWALGYPDQASQAGQDAIAWAEQLTHANSKGNPLCWGGAMLDLLLRRAAQAEAKARELIRFCDAARLPFWGSYGRVFLGIAIVDQGDGEAGLEMVRAGFADLSAAGGRGLVPLLLGWAAEAEAKAGLVEDAQRTIEQALASLADTGQAIWEAELYRMRAGLRLFARPSEQADVEHDLQHALELAHRQQARTVELRAATDLARLWRDQGKDRKAHDLLAPIYGWFTEGFDPPDLKEAAALLHELRE